MRKFILIAAMVLASATAQAGQSRSLTMASNDETVAVEQQPASTEVAKTSEAKTSEAKTSETKSAEVAAPTEAAKPADAPKYVERPPAVEPAADQAKAVPEKGTRVAKAEKPKHRHELTEARVIYELHRHGIYW